VHVKSLYPTATVGTQMSKLARWWHSCGCSTCLLYYCIYETSYLLKLGLISVCDGLLKFMEIVKIVFV
jgi:hypothetical protein